MVPCGEQEVCRLDTMRKNVVLEQRGSGLTRRMGSGLDRKGQYTKSLNSEETASPVVKS